MTVISTNTKSLALLGSLRYLEEKSTDYYWKKGEPFVEHFKWHIRKDAKDTEQHLDEEPLSHERDCRRPR